MPRLPRPAPALFTGHRRPRCARSARIADRRASLSLPLFASASGLPLGGTTSASPVPIFSLVGATLAASSVVRISDLRLGPHTSMAVTLTHDL